MFKVLFVVLSALATVNAGCDNACSGHGTCGQRGICTCYDNWGLGLAHYSGDCSQRICPFEISWIDTPDKIGGRHKYAECANRGICNRDTGECECFPGYEGKGCQRTVCPNDCSGHGRCAYLEDLPYKTTYMEFDQGNFLPQEPATMDYYNWDKRKTRGCICDPEYGDVDCSKRMCPYATDIMDQRDNMLAEQKYHSQRIYLGFYRNWEFDENYNNLRTFALTFKSKLNETFTTYPIVLRTRGPTVNLNPGGDADFHDLALDIERALMSLPNRVIDKVRVQADWKSLAELHLNITFTGDHVQGTQNPLTVKSYYCGDGCTPRLTGLELLPNTQNVTTEVSPDFNSYECGRRGKCDYNTGLCQCFAGYTGIGCNIITSLV